jgi:adenine-specific DNA-methyltransferase
VINQGTHFAQFLWEESDHTIDMDLSSERELISAAIGLGARRIGEWSRKELDLTSSVRTPSPKLIDSLRKQIKAGDDPLGEALCGLRSPQVKRGLGATFTPIPIVDAMVSWAGSLALNPQRVIEPGAGSGRFLLAAAKTFPRALLLGIESDPVAAIIARANLAARGFSNRAQVILADYRLASIQPIDGRSLFIGNPPYVRHHQLDADGKVWLSQNAKRLGLKASQLAGLHVHFFLATALKARKGDFGAFITSAEWLDVNYGRLVRQLFLDGLGGHGITLVEPTSRTFADAATTTAITQFIIGSRPERIRMSRTVSVDRKQALTEGELLSRSRFESANRWSILSLEQVQTREGYIELGELCEVHRGQVTGANRIWIVANCGVDLPESVLFPSVTRAKELFAAGDALEDVSALKSVIDIPLDLSVFARSDRRRIEVFLAKAKAMGADRSYVAKNRRAWWSVGLRRPAPILATYMARRPPAFVRNLADARHINIAHGIYPRAPLSPRILDRLAHLLSSAAHITEGRTYAGGLTKFEPKEMERILIPDPTEMEAEQVA